MSEKQTKDFTPVVLSHDKDCEDREIKTMSDILNGWNDRIREIESFHKLKFGQEDVPAIFRREFQPENFFKDYFPDLPEYMREQMIQKVLQDINKLQVSVIDAANRYPIDSITTFKGKRIILNDYFFEDIRDRNSIVIRSPQMYEMYEKASQIEVLAKELTEFFGLLFIDLFEIDNYTPSPVVINGNFNESK